ncbi:hypothetical protein PENTCL1PPCAC_29039, partial [Pristionchus entomophagus]
ASNCPLLKYIDQASLNSSVAYTVDSTQKAEIVGGINQFKCTSGSRFAHIDNGVLYTNDWSMTCSGKDGWTVRRGGNGKDGPYRNVPVGCVKPKEPEPSCVALPDASATCEKTFSGRCDAATNSNMIYSCPNGQLFFSGSRAPVATCDQCTVSCVNGVWTLSQGFMKLPTKSFVGENPIVACIKPPTPPPCGFLPDATASCRNLAGTLTRDCYAATYSASTYSCPGGALFYTASNPFSYCPDLASCALTCSGGRWTDGSSNGMGSNLSVACLAFTATSTCSALRDATPTCNRTFPGRCSPATYSNSAYSCSAGKLFVYGSRSLVATVDGLKCANGLWTVTQGEVDVAAGDFVGARPIVSCVI